jgi:Uma2 family endonuclease
MTTTGKLMTGEEEVAYKSNATLGAAGRSRSFREVLPDFVVEIVSPTDAAADIEQKALEWLGAGVRLVAVLYPETRTVMVYRGPNDVRHFTAADTLDLEPVLPGFSCPVARLFPED